MKERALSLPCGADSKGPGLALGFETFHYDAVLSEKSLELVSYILDSLCDILTLI